MRALLVFNPFATSTSEHIKDQIARQLSTELELTVQPTEARGEATELAKNAQSEGYELVIGYGGDGTINELANGLLHDGPNVQGPALAAIPGGNANVFARNLEFSTNPLQATSQLIESVKRKHVKTIGVGKLTTPQDNRWFLFNSGFGIDAEVLAKMDERRQRGKRVTDNMYTAFALKALLDATKHREGSITLATANGAEYNNLQFALVINLAPWIYIGEIPIALTPEATLEKALSIYAHADLSVPGIMHLVRNVFSRRTPETNHRHIALDDQTSMHLHSSIPLWVQVDGEVLAQVHDVEMQYVPDALRIIA